MITGASGFIAHHLIPQFLRLGYEVIGVDKRPIPPNHQQSTYFIQTDVRDLGFRDLLGIDIVVHLAFVTNIPHSVRHPKETTHDNIGMTIHLLEVARETGVKRVVFPSTASLYGNNPTPWYESMPAMPIEPYSWQKLSCESLCQMYAQVYGLPTVVARLFQVFGELQRDDTALAAFLKKKAKGEPLTLTETTAQSTFRSGQRDFIYAGDVANALVRLADDPRVAARGEVYNVCTGRIHTMEEIAKAMEMDVTWIAKREYEVERHEGDVQKLMALDWEPTVDVIQWLKPFAYEKTMSHVQRKDV